MKDSQVKFLIAGLAGAAAVLGILAFAAVLGGPYLIQSLFVDGRFFRVHDRRDGPEVADLWAGYQARYQEQQRELDAAIAARKLDNLYQTVPLHDDTRSKLYIEQDFDAVEARLVAQLGACETPLESQRYSQHVERLCGLSPAEHPIDMLRVLDAWVETRPDSHHARLIRGGFSYKYYWEFHGYPLTAVSAGAGWVDPREQLRQANADLLAAARMSPEDPEPHARLISVWASLREDQQKIDTSFANAVAIAPYHYDAHMAWIHYGQPTFYGGSWRLADDRAAKTAAKGDAFQLLATLEFYSKRQRSEEADKDYPSYHESHLAATEALLEQSPDDVHLIGDAAGYAALAGRSDKAAHWFEKLGNVYPEGSAFSDIVEFDRKRTEAFAQSHLADALRLAGDQRYPKSISAFESVKANHPDAIEAIHGHKIAVVHAAAGDAASLEAHCRWLIERYQDADLATDAERSVKGYLLFAGPHDPALLAEAARRTRYAVEAAAKAGEADLLPWFHLSHGMAEYRLGNHGEAAAWLARAVDDKSLYIRSLAQAFHAMAVHGQGKAAEALALLEEARATAAALPAPGSEEYKKEWTDTLSAQLALREAKNAITR